MSLEHEEIILLLQILEAMKFKAVARVNVTLKDTEQFLSRLNALYKIKYMN